MSLKGVYKGYFIVIIDVSFGKVWNWTEVDMQTNYTQNTIKCSLITYLSLKNLKGLCISILSFISEELSSSEILLKEWCHLNMVTTNLEWKAFRRYQ